MRQLPARYGWIGLILLLAVVLRVAWLSDFPAGLQNDEASFLYNAKLLSETGKDEDGRVYPFYLNSFIDPKPALYAYLQMPLVALMGTSVWAARLPGAIMGVASIGLWYWLLALFGVEKIKRLWLTLLLAISPWHVVVSRGTQEVIMSFSFGLMALVAGVQRKKALLWGSVFLVSAALAVYSYHSTKVILPLLILWLWYLWPALQRETYWRSGWILIGLLVIGLAVVSNRDAFKRLGDVSLWADGHIQAVTQEQISLASDRLPTLIIRGFHNKAVTTLHTFGQNYLTHLDPSFLLFDEPQPRRYVVYNQGLLYSFELVGLLLGLWVVLGSDKKQRRLGLFFLGWWVLSPIPAAVTNQEVPSLVRSFWMVLPLTYFIYFGWEWLIRRWKGWGLAVLLTMYIFSWLRWVESYTVLTPAFRPWHRNVADQQMALKLEGYVNNYDQIVIERFSGQPYIYLALGGLITPDQLQSTYPRRREADFSLGKFDFKAGDCPVKPVDKVLFVVHKTCVLNKEYKIIDRVSYADGNDGYVMVEWKGK